MTNSEAFDHMALIWIYTVFAREYIRVQQDRTTVSTYINLEGMRTLRECNVG